MSTPKNTSIKVSIVISVYNAERRIEDVAKALLAQRFHDPYEIILVNDGSTDDSHDVLDRLKNKHPKIRVFTQKNKGAAAGRNLGIKNARGEYIVISDDDVILEKDWLRKTIPLLKENVKSRKKIGLVHSVIKNNPPEGMTRLQKLMFDYALSSRDANDRNEGLMFMTNAARKDVLIDVGLYDEQFDSSGAGADLDLVYRLMDAGYAIEKTDAKALHLESAERFALGFFLTKPYSWGKALAKLTLKRSLRRLHISASALSYPFALLSVIFLIILCIISRYFLLLIPVGMILYAYMRRKMMKRLIERKRGIVSMLFLCMMDVIRICIYNLGAMHYYIFRR